MTVVANFLTDVQMYSYLILLGMLGASYLLARDLSLIYLRCRMDDEDPRKLLIPLDKKELIKSLALFMIYGLCLIYSGKIRELSFYAATLIFLCLQRILYKLNKTEIDIITETNNLSVGYGQALSYYENYLKLTIPERKLDFQTRIRMFETKQLTELPCKLFILIPHSCKLKTYIDEHDNKYISRCQEILPLDKNVAGIPARRYNITVYQIRNDKLTQSVRCAIEYAQPLKALWFMKEKKILSEQEMYEQRRVFTKSLRQMLCANEDCNKFVELIEFDDLGHDSELHNVLMNHSAIKPYCKAFP